MSKNICFICFLQSSTWLSRMASPVPVTHSWQRQKSNSTVLMQCIQCLALGGRRRLAVTGGYPREVECWVLMNKEKLKKEMRGKGFSDFYEKACLGLSRRYWNATEGFNQLSDIIGVTVKLCFWYSSKGLDYDYQSWLFIRITWRTFTTSPCLEFNPDQLNQNKDRDRDLDFFFFLFFFFFWSFPGNSNGFRNKIIG